MIGVSNHTPAQVAALRAHLGVPLVSVQPELSAVHLAAVRDGTLDQAMEHGLAVLAWSPLAGGRIATGDGVPPALLAVLDRIGAANGVDRVAVALAFVLAHPSAPVAIVGSQRLDRLAAAVAAVDVPLTRADVYAIIQASEGQPLP
jgi:predicted oxidoreductase